MDQLRKSSNVSWLVKANQIFSEREKKYFAVEFNNEREKLRLRREKEERERGAKVCPTIVILCLSGND